MDDKPNAEHRSEVSYALERQVHANNRLEELLNVLHGKLERILSPATPENKPDAPEFTTALAQDIGHSAMRGHSAADSMESLINRIEL